ncbi:phytanoyl-CoA dioxygenase family protein [Fictibacillus enclensis]|uniref:phytanoyl-CoA dioxygenase family protein n=1 Tax=Fictibacillus enclensis TaxID=1017270 RepID=UPI0025A21492|nr:phytanoyl-CoA dioxygenase family protein [Fictibacillus enclensis]MDM5335856.1 phytanoyl-CoA dioxygenase family protein [Fictibacillus enclensis]
MKCQSCFQTKEYDLPKQLIEDYKEKGHVKIPQLATKEEIALIRPTILKVFQHNMLHSEDYGKGKSFPKVVNLWELHKCLQHFIWSRRFAKVAAQLMNTSAVRLYHDSALFLEPGGEDTPWHQDKTYAQVDANKMVTLWMPLIDLPEEIGSMQFIDGSHKDELEVQFMDLIRKGLPLSSYDALQAGDATFHSGWTLHYAPKNNTSLLREVITIVYYDADAKIINPSNHSGRVHIDRLFPGMNPGDVAASKLNPVLYSAKGDVF